VAVLPSIWPEAYGLVVDECLAAGVPVVAFALGAVGDRLKDWEAGAAVPAELNAPGLARAAVELLNSRKALPASLEGRIPTTDETARRHLDLYLRLVDES
jgi:glycosyltransferase involved in cell wall biosynthesis